MKVLFNCTTNVVGGGAKNSALFIRHAMNCAKHDWLFAVSKAVDRLLEQWEAKDERVILFDRSPAKSRVARRKLLDLQRSEQADIVFTMAGPAYVGFSCRHVMGISNGYISHIDVPTFLATRSARSLPVDAARIAYQSFHARRADHLVFQTETARTVFCRRLRFDPARTSVVANAFDADWETAAEKPSMEADRPVSILVPAMPYSHKMLSSVPAIARELRSMANGRPEFEFVLTIDPNGADWQRIEAESHRLGVADSVRTIGSYSYAEAAGVHAGADLIFVPSVLETFSASYLEAFAARRPLVVADRAFARELCGDAACYIEPTDPAGTARDLLRLVSDIDHQNAMVEKGFAMLSRYGSQKDRFERLLALIETNDAS